MYSYDGGFGWPYDDEFGWPYDDGSMYSGSFRSGLGYVDDPFIMGCGFMNKDGAPCQLHVQKSTLKRCQFLNENVKYCKETFMQKPGECREYCDKHRCPFKCELPMLSCVGYFTKSTTGHAGNMCRARTVNHCQKSLKCNLHNRCEGRCKYIRCSFPGCDHCFSHINVCGYCHPENDQKCLLHDICYCGTPKKRDFPRCGACAFDICVDEFMKNFSLPIEILQHIHGYVKGPRLALDFSRYFLHNRTLCSGTCSYTPREFTRHYQNVIQTLTYMDEWFDDEYEDYFWFEDLDPDLSRHDIDCVELEDEFFNTHPQAY